MILAKEKIHNRFCELLEIDLDNIQELCCFRTGLSINFEYPISGMELRINVGNHIVKGKIGDYLVGYHASNTITICKGENLAKYYDVLIIT